MKCVADSKTNNPGAESNTNNAGTSENNNAVDNQTKPVVAEQPQGDDDCVAEVRLAFLGSKNAGKTSILNRICFKKFDDDYEVIIKHYIMNIFLTFSPLTIEKNTRKFAISTRFQLICE